MSNEVNEYLPAIGSLSSRIDSLESFYSEVHIIIERYSDRIEKIEEQIKKLQEAYHADAQVCKDIIFDGARRSEEIQELKKDMLNFKIDIEEIKKQSDHDYDERITDLENIQAEHRLIELEEKQSAMLTMPNVVWRKYHKTPHKCPVCDGNGKDKGVKTYNPNDFSIIYANCLTCEGKGIVWG